MYAWQFWPFRITDTNSTIYIVTLFWLNSILDTTDSSVLENDPALKEATTGPEDDELYYGF